MATPTTSASAQIAALVRARKAAHPDESNDQAWAAVKNDPENAPLMKAYAGELGWGPKPMTVPPVPSATSSASRVRPPCARSAARCRVRARAA